MTMRMLPQSQQLWFSFHRKAIHLSRRCISSSKLTIERTTDTTNYDNRPAKEDLVFGTTLSDHMLMVEWNKQHQWESPRIVPYQDLKISPAASCLHYGKAKPHPTNLDTIDPF